MFFLTLYKHQVSLVVCNPNMAFQNRGRNDIDFYTVYL